MHSAVIRSNRVCLLKHLDGQVLVFQTPNLKVLGLNPARGGIQLMTMVLYCTEPFVIILPLSRYDLMFKGHKIPNRLLLLQDNAAVPLFSQAFLNITLTDANDNSPAYLLPGCLSDNRGYCVAPVYTSSVISGSLVSICSVFVLVTPDKELFFSVRKF